MGPIANIAEAGLFNGTARLQPPIGQHNGHLAGRSPILPGPWLRFLYDQRTGKATGNLLPRAVMRVIPIGARIGGDEIVVEGIAGLHRVLGQTSRTVHRIVDADAVPVNRRRLRQPVRQSALNALARANTDFRTWYRPGAALRPIGPDVGQVIAVRRDLRRRRPGKKHRHCRGAGDARQRGNNQRGGRACQKGSSGQGYHEIARCVV